MLGVLVVGLVLAMGAARLGGALVGRARAESAADAAALAAADRLALGDGARVRRAAAAATTADEQRRPTRVVYCSGTTAEVVVEVDVPAWGALSGRPGAGQGRGAPGMRGRPADC